MKNLFNTKIKIETLEKKLSQDNVWITEYKFWKELWASVSIKDISSRRVLYLFSVKWKRDFPNNFRVIINDKIFTPTQSPIMNSANDSVLFHAALN